MCSHISPSPITVFWGIVSLKDFDFMGTKRVGSGAMGACASSSGRNGVRKTAVIGAVGRAWCVGVGGEGWRRRRTWEGEEEERTADEGWRRDALEPVDGAVVLADELVLLVKGGRGARCDLLAQDIHHRRAQLPPQAGPTRVQKVGEGWGGVEQGESNDELEERHTARLSVT